MRNNLPVTNVEIQLDQNVLIVSKTDLKGQITFINKDFIDSYLELKWEEVFALEHTPHPIEFQMYYSS